MPQYQCVNKRCRDYHKRFRDLPSGERRKFGLGAVHCDRCGKLAMYVQGTLKSYQVGGGFIPDVPA